MRIAIIVPGFSVDADDWAIPALQALAGALAKRHDVHVFSLRYPARGIYRFAELTHRATGGGHGRGPFAVSIWYRTIQAVIRQHSRTPFDVLHAFWADEAGFAAVLAGARLGRPAVVSLGGGELTYLPDINYGTRRSAVRRLMIRFVLRRALLVTAGSEYQCGLARAQGVPTGKLRQLPLGVDTARFRPGPIPDWDRPTIIQAASLTPVKNQSLLLEVTQLVRQSVPGTRLLLVGSGPLRDHLRREAERQSMSAHVSFMSAVPHSDMPGVYRQGHLYLQTSHHESQGMSVLEAMACGLPALGTPVGILPEVAARQPDWSAETLASQVCQLMLDYAGYAKARRQARLQIEGEFSLLRSLAGFEAIYQDAEGCWQT